MGKVVCCEECRKAYRNPEALEDLRDNDSICLVCNTPIEVADWDRVLASYEDEDYDDDHVDEEQDEDDFGDDLDGEELDDEELDDDDFGDDFGELDGQPISTEELDDDFPDDEDED